MEESTLNQPQFIGREEELERLLVSLEEAVAGKGSTVLISGEAGIGKTRLIQEFRRLASERDVKVISGAAIADSASPFLVFSKALEEISKPFFTEQETSSFSEVFAINPEGLLIASATPDENELDADIFAGMLTAVQSFVRDSFDRGKKSGGDLGGLEYGNMKIMIEYGKSLFLTAVLRGREHPEMRLLLRHTVLQIDEEYGTVLDSWMGNMDEVAKIQDAISVLTDAEFLIPRDLESAKLENERIKIADQVLDSLVRVADGNPLLVFLEDLHWADESSLFVLNFIARNIRSEKILVIGTHRPQEIIDPLQKTIGKMRDEGIITEIGLERLGHELVEGLIHDLYAPNCFPMAFVDKLSSHCDGNPFFIIEMLNQMWSEGRIIIADGLYTLVSEYFNLPASVSELVHCRLDLLEPDTMMLAEYLSCAGRKFDRNIAFALLSVNDALSAIENLGNNGILTSSDGILEFSHALFQDAIYQSINGRWRSVYHESLGDYYEGTYDDDLDDVLFELANQYSRSKNIEKSFKYCMGAAAKAESSFAVELSIEYYNKCLAVLPKLTGDTYANKNNEICERLGDLHTLTSEYDRAIDNFRDALIYQGDTRKKADLHRKLAQVYEKKGEFDKCLAESDKGLGMVEGDECVEKAKLLGAKGWTYIRTGEYNTALEYLTLSSEMARRLEDEAVQAQAYHSIGSMHIYESKYSEALENLEKSLHLSEKNKDLAGISKSLNNIGLAYIRLGEMDKSLDYFRRGLAIFEKTGDKYGIAAAENNIGMMYKTIGEFDKALGYYKKSLAIQEMIDDKMGASNSLNNIASIHNLKGEYEQAIGFHQRNLELRKTIEDRHGIGITLNNMANAYFNKGDMSKARECGLESLEINNEIGNYHAAIHNYCCLAEVSLALADPLEADAYLIQAYEMLPDFGKKLEEGMVHRIQGMICRENGNFERAVEEFDETLSLAEEKGLTEVIAKTHFEKGLLLIRYNILDNGKVELMKALEIFEKLGMRHWVEKAKGVL